MKCAICGRKYKNKRPTKVPSIFCSVECSCFMEKIASLFVNHVKKMWSKKAPKITHEDMRQLLKANSTTYSGNPKSIINNPAER